MWIRWGMALFHFGAGIVHLRSSPDGFLAITPEWGPISRGVILATRACEIAVVIALITTSLRW